MISCLKQKKQNPVKKIILSFVFSIFFITSSACGEPVEKINPAPAVSGEDTEKTKDNTTETDTNLIAEDETEMKELPLDIVQNRGYRFFTKPSSSWVGDVMPYYEDGVYNIFFLDDARDGAPTFHPFALATTENFTEYDYKGIVIPCGNTTEQDIAIGTGSVIKANDGKYHAFYTGHNYKHQEQGVPREAMMHAVSDDMINFIKIPEDTFFAADNYEKNDFRDPYVIWMEDKQEYWMLITARINGKGVVARYSSKDLSNWKLEEPLFHLNKNNVTECPDLFKMGDYWYLIYSTEWMTWYVYSENPDGPWIVPEYNRFDGKGFYAAKTGGTSEKRYLFGWIPTKSPAKDSGKWEWAGNMSAMELYQNEDGTLRAGLPQQISELFNENKKSITHTLDIRGETEFKNGTLIINGSNDVSGAVFGTVYDKMLIEADISISDGAEWVGFTSNFQHDITAGYGINFDKKKGEIKYIEGILKKFRLATSNNVFVPADLKKNEKMHIKILIDNDCAVLYLDDTVALSTRQYKLTGSHWGFYAINGTLKVENITYSTIS